MSLDKLTKIDGGGISTTSDYRVGVITATKFVGPVEGSITATDASFSGNVSIAGTLTYEDVTNVDSVGILTARSGIHIDDSISHIGDTDTKIRFHANDTVSVETGGSQQVTIGTNVNIISGELTLPDTIRHRNDANTKIRFPADDTVTIETAGSERFRISSSGRVAIGTDSSTSATGLTVYRDDTGVGNIVNIEQDGTGDAVLGFAIKGTAAWQFGIDNSDSDKFKVSYDGSGLDSSTAVTVDRSGHVGIGTNTPGAVLHVEKNGTNLVLARFESNMGTNNNRALSLTSPRSDSSSLPFTFSTGNSIEFKCDSHVVHIDDNGKLGIGTDDPLAQLHIYQGTSGDCELIIESDTNDSNENDNPRIIFKQDGGNAQAAIEQLNNALTISNSVSSGGGIVFKTGSVTTYTNATERFRITPDGEVLIGNNLTNVNNETTGTLVVDGGDNNIGGIQVHAGGGENSGDLAGISFSHGLTGTAARPKAAIAFECNASGYGRGDLCFYVDNATDNSKVSNVNERVRFKNNGLVGINTSDPLAKLNVYTELGTDTGGILVQNVTYANNQNRPYLTVGTKGWTGATTNWNTAGFQHRIKTDSGGTPRVTIDGAGGELFCVRNDAKVGINQATPTEKLHVDGNIKLTGQLMQSTPADFWSQGNTFIELNGVGNLTHMGSYETCLTSNGYRDNNAQWKSYAINSNAGAAQIRLNPAGSIIMGAEASKSDGSSHNVTERLRISSAGNVGIASASPTTRLDVFATGTTIAQFGDSRSTSFECIRIKNDVAGYPAISNDSSPDTLDLRSMGSVQATIDANNNSTGKYFRVVHNGAGNSGTVLLNVSDNGVVYMPRGVISLTRQGASNYVEIGSGQNANNYAYVDMVGDSTYTDYGLRLIRGNTGANASSQLLHRGTGTLSIQTTEAAQIDFRTSGNNNRLSIEAGGNVGINTNNPDHRFHVYHPTVNTVAKFESGDAGCGMLFKDLTATTRIEQYNTEFKIDHDTEGLLADSSRHINLDLNGTTKLSVHHEGVRIGSNVTGTPSQMLQVDGNIYLGPNNTNRVIHSGASLGFTADSNMYFVCDSNDTSGVAPGGEFIWGGGSETNTDSNQNFTEAEFGNGFKPRNQYMYLNESHLRPTSNGGINLGSGSYRWGQIYSTSSSISTSDRNEKKDIIDCDLGLDFICKLNPVSFKWNIERNKKADTKVHYGLIAQDVEEVILSEGKTLDEFGAVDKSEEEDASMGLSYSELIAPMIKALQEANEKIKILETEVAALKSL